MTRKTWRTMRILFGMPEGLLFTCGPWRGQRPDEPEAVVEVNESYIALYQPCPPMVRYPCPEPVNE